MRQNHLGDSGKFFSNRLLLLVKKTYDEADRSYFSTICGEASKY